MATRTHGSTPRSTHSSTRRSSSQTPVRGTVASKRAALAGRAKSTHGIQLALSPIKASRIKTVPAAVTAERSSPQARPAGS